MAVSQKKRHQASSFSAQDTAVQNKTKNASTENTGKRKKKDQEKNNLDIQEEHSQGAAMSWSVVLALNVFLGVVALIGAGYLHSLYMYQLHENQLWFSNIQEVEREISFRTESGLYYSYFKQLVNSNIFVQGIHELTRDKVTEHPDTINVLARMNIYQEVILAAIYRFFGISLQPILFYIYSIFCLHGFMLSALCLLTWLLSNSWLAGVLTAAFYMFNRLDTTRVDSTVPLRENFALPFLWIQAAALTVYFKPRVGRKLEVFVQVIILLNTFLFCLFWQFNQFIMLLQAFSVYGVWVLGLLPANKVLFTMSCQLVSLLAVCALQFGNKMILSSLAVSFIFAALCMVILFRDASKPQPVIHNIFGVMFTSFVPLILMVVLSSIIKNLLKVDSDEHIFKFLRNKLGVGNNSRDFDSRMYLCLDIFGTIKKDIFVRLTNNYVLPFYIVAHTVLLGCLVYTVVRRWIRLHEMKEHPSSQATHNTNSECLLFRPELAFHTVQAVMFGLLALSTMRMKYFWTPYMCVLAAVGIADRAPWSRLLALANVHSRLIIDAVRCSAILILLSVMVKVLLPPVLNELKNEMEFWDPDTVELMTWIMQNTPAKASFTGSMQLLAGVKLCTGRHITNHPHYEDKYLRQKTKELYQIYGRRMPEDISKILHKYKSDYIILEDSICRAPSKDGCRLPDIVDIDSGVMPDTPVDIKGLITVQVPRFCEEVRYEKPSYSLYFKTVFVNKTFRVYQVL